MDFESFTNAPLEMVEFTLWWHVGSQLAFQRSENFMKKMISDVTDIFEENFSVGQAFPEFNPPISPFTKHEFIGAQHPNLRMMLTNEALVINHSKNDYNWSNLEAILSTVLEKALVNLTKFFNDIDHIHLALQYENFIEFSIDSEEPQEFINSNFNATFNLNGVSDPPKVKSIGYLTKYDFEDEGSLQVLFSDETIRTKKGIHIKLRADSKKESLDHSEIMKWALSSRENCYKIFSEVCSEELIKSFNDV